MRSTERGRRPDLVITLRIVDVMPNQEKTTKPLSVIERLKAENPGKNIADVAVGQLDNPEDMAQFLIQYAQDLGKTSDVEETRAHPLDTAVKVVYRLATLRGGDIKKRWYELIDTGTVQNPPDHSLDWITPGTNGRK